MFKSHQLGNLKVNIFQQLFTGRAEVPDFNNQRHKIFSSTLVEVDFDESEQSRH